MDKVFKAKVSMVDCEYEFEKDSGDFREVIGFSEMSDSDMIKEIAFKHVEIRIID
jgi:hypothetical protein